MRHAMTASMVAARCKRHAERKAVSSTLQPDLSTRKRSSIRRRREIESDDLDGGTEVVDGEAGEQEPFEWFFAVRGVGFAQMDDRHWHGLRSRDRRRQVEVAEADLDPCAPLAARWSGFLAAGFEAFRQAVDLDLDLGLREAGCAMPQTVSGRPSPGCGCAWRAPALRRGRSGAARQTARRSSLPCP